MQPSCAEPWRAIRNRLGGAACASRQLWSPSSDLLIRATTLEIHKETEVEGGHVYISQTTNITGGKSVFLYESTLLVIYISMPVLVLSLKISLKLCFLLLLHGPKFTFSALASMAWAACPTPAGEVRLCLKAWPFHCFMPFRWGRNGGRCLSQACSGPSAWLRWASNCPSNWITLFYLEGHSGLQSVCLKEG